MDNQLAMDTYLLVLKSTVEVYVHGTLESSNKKVRDLLKQCLDDTITAQSKTYDKMTEYGWYTINNVTAEEINKKLCNIQSKS